MCDDNHKVITRLLTIIGEICTASREDLYEFHDDLCDNVYGVGYYEGKGDALMKAAIDMIVKEMKQREE
jgi:hypothetical protein